MSEHDQPIAPNVLARRFDAAHPNQRWVGDTTELLVGGSAQVYLAAILHVYSRFIVGWAPSAVNDRHLMLRALEMAVKRRCPDPGRCIIRIKAAPRPATTTACGSISINCSMSRRGNCYDNAVIESWFSTVKSEEDERFKSYARARKAVVDYIDVLHNQRRRHSTLGQTSPAAFERRAGYAAKLVRPPDRITPISLFGAATRRYEKIRRRVNRVEVVYENLE